MALAPDEARFRRCTATTVAGYACRSRALRGLDVCGMHKQSRAFSAVRQSEADRLWDAVLGLTSDVRKLRLRVAALEGERGAVDAVVEEETQDAPVLADSAPAAPAPRAQGVRDRV
jgi:hypothetical protein